MTPDRIKRQLAALSCREWALVAAGVAGGLYLTTKEPLAALAGLAGVFGARRWAKTPCCAACGDKAAAATTTTTTEPGEPAEPMRIPGVTWPL
jgi:hypothetical protein